MIRIHRECKPLSLLHCKQYLRKFYILRSRYLYVGVIACRHCDLAADSFDQLAVIGEIKSVFKCKIYSLEVKLSLEYLRSLRDI